MSGRQDTTASQQATKNQDPRCRYCGSKMRRVMVQSAAGIATGYCPKCDGPVMSLPPGDNAERHGRFIANMLRMRPGFEA